MVSKSTTVTRISKATLVEVRELAKEKKVKVVVILDEMLALYKAINNLNPNRKEVKIDRNNR